MRKSAMPFKKGRRKTGGRKKGVPNKITAEIKQLLLRVYSDEIFAADIEKLRKERDPRVRLEILKLALAYASGKPVMPVVGVEESPPLTINVSAIPKQRELAN